MFTPKEEEEEKSETRPSLRKWEKGIDFLSFHFFL